MEDFSGLTAMDATPPEGLPLMTRPIRKFARRVALKKDEPQLQLFASAARHLYDSNRSLPPKKRFPGLSVLLDQELSMPKKRKRRKPLTKELIKEELSMPEALAEKIRGMGGERVQLVMQKQLRETDITVRHSRLSIPRTKIKTNAEFLSETEKDILGQQVADTQTMRGIEVLVIDPRLEELMLWLKRWKMNSNYICNLTENWNTLVKDNALEAGDTIQLWAFRAEERGRRGMSDLCFALVKLEQANNGVAAVPD